MIKKITLLMSLFVMTFVNAQNNLALNKTTASSFVVEDPALPGPGTDTSTSAVDGDTGTRWESQHTDVQWWSVDLGAEYNIGNIIIYWEASYGKKFNIEFSRDNNTWTPAYSEADGKGGIAEIPVLGIARYIRYSGAERGTGYGYSFFEFQVYEAISANENANLSSLTVNGVSVANFVSTNTAYNVELPAGSKDVPTVIGTPKENTSGAVNINAAALPGTTTVLVTAADGTTTKTYTINFTVARENIALNKSATASTEDMAAADAFDGNANSRWASAITDPQWIYVDLEKLYDVTGVTLNWEGAFALNYVIEVSDDALVWNEVFSTEAGAPGEIYIPFTSTTSRYVRMYGTQRGTPYGYSLWEFEVHGTDHALSTENVEATNFSVYPNPTSGTINIRSNSKLDTVEVLDINGRVLLKTKSNSININELHNGLYILKIIVNGIATTTKIIKK